jgi:hypothetical protein
MTGNVSAETVADLGRLTRVLVTLKHELSLTRRCVPELDATVFGAGHDPVAIRRDSDGENVVLHGKFTTRCKPDNQPCGR